MQPLSMPSATLGDTVNNANINTTGGVNGAAPYNRTFLLVATADDGAYERVARAVERRAEEQAHAHGRAPEEHAPLAVLDIPLLYETKLEGECDEKVEEA